MVIFPKYSQKACSFLVQDVEVSLSSVSTLGSTLAHGGRDKKTYKKKMSGMFISIKVSLKFVPQGPINNIPALVQIMAWCHPGNEPLSESMMAWFTEAYIHHSA